MEINNYLRISGDCDAIQDLRNWLCSEYVVITTDVSNAQSQSLGEESGIRIALSTIKKGVEQFIELIKNWAYNYNKDIELCFEDGSKKATIKCPAKRVSDEDLNQIFTALSDFFR